MKELQQANAISNIPPTNSSSVAVMDPLLAMIERAARDPSIDMDRLERLLEMKERAELRQASADFNEAMARVQGEIGPIARDSFNPQTRSKYASYFAVDKAIRPIYVKHGFRVSFNEEQQAGEGVIRVIAIVTKGMHRELYHYDSPIVTTGLAGKAMMTLTHARAAAVTYAKRYLMGMIFNLSTGEDLDGNPPADSTPLVTEQQITEISKLLGNNKDKIAALCKHLKVEALNHMTQAVYESAKSAIQAKQREANRLAKMEPDQ